MIDESLVASGGWCAPKGVLFPTGDVSLPTVNASRGNIRFGPSSPTEIIESRHRIAQRRRQDAIENACVEATANGWDVHLFYGWGHDHVGIEFRPAKYAIPTIVEHPAHDVSWLYDRETGEWDDD